ncbi:MAG: peptidylprolyl isomerase [Verrucomicrobia bacterium]|nr:peptidylprolyl isomerase [Verrucomicrobiota bacterium]
MKTIALTALAAIALAFTAGAQDKKAAKEVAVLKFKDFGEITVEFWPEVAPKTVENFIKLSKDKFFDGTQSHRLIPGFMIQLGDPKTKDPTKENEWGTGDPGYKIKAEFNDRPHDKGVLSMARSAHPDSAGSQFFICFTRERTAQLDRQYTVFGKVLKGLDVLDKLEKVPVGGPQGSKPQRPVVLESVKIIAADSAK